MGCNVVRLHHLDSDWSPNIIDATSPDGTTQHLDPADMRKLDRLIFELKSRGIYVILDPWVGRSYRPGDNVPGSDKFQKGNFGLHPYIFFDPRMRDLHKLFLSRSGPTSTSTPPRLQGRPRVRHHRVRQRGPLRPPQGHARPLPHAARPTLHPLVRRKASTPASPTTSSNSTTPKSTSASTSPSCTTSTPTSASTSKRTSACKIPINSSNWFHWPWEIGAQADGDFMDSHHYYHGNRIGPTSAMGGLWTQNPPANGDTPFSTMIAMAIYGKPLTSSECGDNPPQTYRSSYYVGLAAVACLQGYDSITPYAYSQAPEPYAKLANFEMESDPATVASLTAGTLIYRRGDVQPAKDLAVLLLPTDEQYAMHWENGYEKAFDHTPSSAP